jgi:hypothetical protein
MRKEDDLRRLAGIAGLKYIGPYQGVMVKTAYECAQHGQILQTPNKVQQGLGCQKCGRERQVASRRLGIKRVEEDALSVGLKYVSGYTSVARNAVYQCPVHGEIRMRPAVVKRGASCRLCARVAGGLKRRKPKSVKVLKREPRVSLEMLHERARAVGLTYADDYVTSNAPARYVCEEHGEIRMNPAVVRRGSGCKFCSGNVPKNDARLEAEAAAIGLRFIGPYLGDSKSTIYECPKHGLIRKMPGSVKQGGLCRYCAKYGFDPVAPAVFYVYRVERVSEPSFIGYGLTKDHATRHAAHLATFHRAGAVAHLVTTFEMSSGRAAADLELHIQSVLRDRHVRTTLRGFKHEAVEFSEEHRLLAIVADWMDGRT